MAEYTAEELANATPGEWEAILDDFDIGSDYEKYFAKFDQSELENIRKNFQNQIGSLDQKHQQMAQKTIGSVSTKMGQMGDQSRASMAQRGFAGAGDISSRMNQQKGQLLSGAGQDLQGSAAMTKLQKEGAGIAKDESIRSAYSDYQDQFYGTLGTVESLRDDGGGGKK
tara:strand:- start:1302 stop:1808 length:507 start_codon:yes stop_codon:yes gene_type:complete